MRTMQWKRACEELYQDMMNQIYQCRKLDLSSTGRITYCFKVAIEHWDRLREKVKSRRFVNKAEEIWFFRTMKPRFTCLIEYYTLVYHAELFIISLEEEDIPPFLEKENERIKNFHLCNQDFIDYYSNGRTDCDPLYFTRNRQSPPNNKSRPYDAEPAAISSHDHLVSSIMAFEMYAAYILQHQKE
jgi:hypothetical protein